MRVLLVEDDPTTAELTEAALKSEGIVCDVTDCSAPGSLDTSLSHAAGLIEIAACHA